MGVLERLDNLKKAQEAAKQQKEQAEKDRKEKEKGELIVQRKDLIAQFSEAEKSAKEASEAIEEADKFEKESVDSLDAETKEELEAIKKEAQDALEKFEEIKNKLAHLNEEIARYEDSATENIEIGEGSESISPEIIGGGSFEGSAESMDSLNLSPEAEEYFKEFEQNIEYATNAIKSLKDMEPKSRERYERAFKLRDEIEKMFSFENSLDNVPEVSSKEGDPNRREKRKIAKERLEELNGKRKQVLKDLMIAWWGEKGEYEEGRSAEIAKNYIEIAENEISPGKAKEMLSNEALDDGGKEYIATELMKKFMEKGDDKTVLDIAEFARKNGFYLTMTMDALNSHFVRSLKLKKSDLYERAKETLGPNTKPYA